jgi:hypothetical protein
MMAVGGDLPGRCCSRPMGPFMAKRRSVCVVFVVQTGGMKDVCEILFENLAKLLLENVVDEGIKSCWGLLRDKITVGFTAVGRGDVDWVYLYGCRVHRHACVNTVMSLGFHNRRGIHGPTE